MTIMQDSFGQRLRHLREARGWRQSDLSALVGTEVDLSRLERDMKNPKIDTLRKLAKALGVRIADLTGEE